MSYIANDKKTMEIATSGLAANTVHIQSKYLDASRLEYFKKEFEKQLMEKFATVPTFEHKCHNCGGTLEMKATEHIFKCPYCGSVYAIGTAMINNK